MRHERPCGSWPSSIAAERIAAGALRLAQPRLDGDSLYWLEGRPREGGRQVVMRVGPGETPVEVTPPGVNVRTRVHEYGGGDYLVSGGRLFFVDFADQRVHAARVDAAGRAADVRPLTRARSRFADFALSPDGRWLAAVEERPREGREPENRIVAISTDGGAPRVVAAGRDFASAPRFAPDGSRLAFTAWDHPNMPWDGTELFVLAWGPDGPAGAPRRVAGGPRESIFQPDFSPAGVLTFVSDASGWWNLHQLRGDRVVPLCPRAAEFGRPQWELGMATWAFVDEDTLLCRYRESGRDWLARLDLRTGALRPLPLPFTAIDGVRVARGRACFTAATPSRSGVHTLALDSGAVCEHRASLDFDLEPEAVAAPEALSFPSEDGRTAHAFVYRPTHPSVRPPTGERPPLLVKSHGGPTGAASPGLNVGIQYWTSRGFAVADVDYGGSTGYGRAYRELLYGQWGVVDVEDCRNAALHLAAEKLVDPARLAITGGSAGGFTTLAALTFHDTFAAGASHYGVADLEALARDTHKFESRYLDRLVGPYPEARDVYVARSPVHAAERLSCPVAFFQGLDDPIVPPNQAEAMVAALAARGIPHVYVPFEGEQHGFRRAETIVTALEGELWFYAQVFGFPVEVSPTVRRRARLRRGELR